MKHILMSVGVAAMLGGCAQKQVTLQTSFDPTEAAYIFTQGNNSVSGQGFLRQKGGVVVNCASFEVALIPITAYASERIQAIYGNTERGYAPYFLTPAVPSHAEYFRHRRTTQCDAQGNFKFEKVPDGDYYVYTSIMWYAGHSREGGGLMQRISTKGGEHKEVLLTY